MVKIKRFMIFVLLVTHVPFLFSYLYTDPERLLDIDVSLNDAILFHLFCIISFLFGYLCVFVTRKKIIKSDELSVDMYFISRKSLSILLFLSMFGLFVTILQIAINQSIFSYVSDLFSGTSGEEVRDSYLLSSSEGGLPGVIKMFNNAPLAVYLFLTGISSTLSFDNTTLDKIRRVEVFSLFIVCLKVVFSLDRLSVLAIILSFLFKTSRNGISARFIFFIVLSFSLANFLSQSRLKGYTIIDFVLLYMKLGLVNLQLNINHLFHFSFGFETFLHPLVYIMPSFVSFLGFSTPSYEWTWNPALYFVSYAYLDFGYLTFMVYILIGCFAAYLDVMIYSANSKYISGCYLIVLYCLASFVFVPALRGMEFILAVFIAISSSFLFVRKSYVVY